MASTNPPRYYDQGTGRAMTSVEANAALRQQINDLNTQLVKAQEQQKKGLNPDGSPIRPDIITVVNPDGTLKSGMGVDFQQLDPNSLEGYSMLREMATSAGPTDYAKSQMDLAQNMKTQNLNAATSQANRATSQAANTLAMRGGASSGARAMLARDGARNLLNANQGVNLQNTTDMIKINSEDQARKLDLFKSFADTEGKFATANNDIANKTLEFNKQLQGYGIQNANQNTMDAYTAELDKWGAGKQADAARSSGGGGGGGGCCFIFLEARYGTGAMDEVVRRFRDEALTDRNKRGYYKLSEVLVPLMRKSKLVKALVQATMTTPLVAYGKAYYGKGSKLGYVFAPVKNFWLKTFDYLGQDHEFIRENGETV